MPRTSKHQTSKRVTNTNKVAKKSEVFNALVLKGETPANQVLSIIDQKLEAFQGLQESNYRTSGVIEDWDLKTETSVEEIIKHHAELQLHYELFGQSQATLGVKKCKAWQQGGCSLADWTHDMKMKIQLLNEKETIDTLKELQKEWQSKLSENEQRTILMEKTIEKLQNLI